MRSYPWRLLMTVGLIGLATPLPTSAAFEPTPRRTDQFPTDSAHLVVPLPYSYPGVGEGLFLMGNLSNLADTTTDLLLMAITGDAGGYIALIDELPLIHNRLYGKLFYQQIDRAVVNNYSFRGMSATHADDYSLLDMALVRTTQAALTLTFWQRRLNLEMSLDRGEYAIGAIRAPNGDLITQLDDDFISKESRHRASLSFDLTDDHLNPHSGYRLSIAYADQPATEVKDPDYYLLSYNLRWYLPTNSRDTLLLNYFQSDAHVRNKGDTDPAHIRTDLNTGCAPTDEVCLQTEQSLVETIIQQRTRGTAAGFGGNERLRSYPMGRFSGGHSAFVGAEYRWIVRHDIAPFNYLFWKDVRSDIQIALFAEWATVAETTAALWDESRTSVGVGLRLVSDSGSVYRADLAYGDEGSELIVFFFYPWEDQM